MGSLKNQLGKQKTHMSHVYICNNGFIYKYIWAYVYIFLEQVFCISTFVCQKFLGEKMVRPNKTKSPQMPRFQVSHKVQSCFLIKHKYLQLQLAYPKLSNFFWIEINSGWHRSNHPPFHQKKSRKSRYKTLQTFGIRHLQLPRGTHFVQFGLHELARPRGEQTHHTNCHAQPVSQPFHPCERSNVPQW